MTRRKRIAGKTVVFEARMNMGGEKCACSRDCQKYVDGVIVIDEEVVLPCSSMCFFPENAEEKLKNVVT